MPSSNKPIILFDIDNTLFNTQDFKKSGLTQYSAFTEVKKVLSAFHKKAILGIFSQGELEFQKAKLKKTGLYNFFVKEHIYIEILKKDKIEFLIKKYQQNHIYFIDDNLSILESVKKSFSSAIIIWVKRGEYANLQNPIPGFTPDFTITNLTSLSKIIK
jgi:FMN phosphatase YigB (HAD superfamily)